MLILFLSYQTTFAAAEVLVKAGTISISGYSAIEPDLSIIYGGIAGNACASGTEDGINTCNSCIDTASPANACNQRSVYPSLKLSVSFKPTKAITTAAVAKLYLEGTTSGAFNPVATIASATYTTNSTITLETTWSEVCLSAGLNSSCINSPSTTAVLASKRLRFGIDSDSSGEIEEAEAKTVTIKFHFLPAGASGVEQAMCADDTSGIGMCNITFKPGDEKIYIDTAIYSGPDSGSSTAGGTVDWESIAVFPVPTTTGGAAAVYSSFANGKATPILKDFVATGTDKGSIPDSKLEGGINNYQLYCMVYATKNKTQNIYKFVTTGVDTTKSCVTPSEVVGILDDKHCFISTAAFGSESALEVEIFRKFRNQILLKSFFGRSFVKFYYKVSPPIAEIISKNEYLKASTRVALYPFLVFAMLTLKIGFVAALFLMLFVLFATIKISRHLNAKNALVLLIVLISPSLRADIKPIEQTIEHPQAKSGLVRIQQDGTYIYETPRALKSEASHIRLGQANQPDISISIEQTDATGAPTGVFNDYNFKDFYDEDSGLIIGYDYEWFPWIDQGKLGIQAGVSAMFVSGRGRLVATPNPPSVESFTFVTLPLTLGAVYRFEYKDKQLFAPYVSGGGTYVVLAEKREDKALPDVAGGFGFYGSGGVLFNLGALDRNTSYQLDSEYGIGNMWVSVEFKVVEVNSESFSFSNKYLNAGLSFDF